MELTSSEQQTLGNFLIDIGDVLFTTSSLIDIKNSKAEETTKNDQQKADQEKLQKQIDDLQIQHQEMQNTIQELQKLLQSILY